MFWLFFHATTLRRKFYVVKRNIFIASPSPPRYGWPIVASDDATRETAMTVASANKAKLSSNRFTEILRRYRDVWHRDWPHDNATMAELWFEAKAELGIPRQSKKGGVQARKLTIEKMRLDHEF